MARNHHGDRSSGDRTTGVSRRKFLLASGAAGTAGLAGCSLGGGSSDGPQFSTPAGRECNGVEPSLETAKSGEYSPLSRPLFTYPAKGSLARPEVAEFARYFVGQSTNQAVVADDVGYVPNTDAAAQEQLDTLNAAIEEAGGPAPGEAGALSGEITIAGSSTVFPLAEAFAEDFQEDHPDVTISVQSTGSGGGFENFFCPGETDFNNASRPMRQAEKDLCSSNGVGWVELEVATDALTVVVHNDNEWATCLTVDELAQIWGSDPATTWSDVHEEWPDEEIARFGAAETSGTFDYFTEVVNGEEGNHTAEYQPTEQDNVIVSGVRGNTYSIGYFGFAYYSGNPDQVTAVAVDDGQ